MLQPAATSANSSLVLAAGQSGGTAENLEIPEGFAALLALGMTVNAEGEAELATVSKEATATLRQIGTADGNASGKILPLLLPEGDATTAGLDIRPEKPAEAGYDPAPHAEAVPEATLSILAVAVPIPTVSLKVPQVEVGEPKQPSAALLQQAPAAPKAVAAQLVATATQLGAAPAKATERPAPASGESPPAESQAIVTPKAAAALPQRPAEKPALQLSVPTLVVEPKQASAEPMRAEARTVTATGAAPSSTPRPAEGLAAVMPKVTAALPQQPTEKPRLQRNVSTLVVEPEQASAEPIRAEAPVANAAPSSTSQPAKVAIQPSVSLPANPGATRPRKAETTAPTQPAAPALQASEAAASESPAAPATVQPAASAIQTAPVRPNLGTTLGTTIEPRETATEASSARTFPTVPEPGVADPVKPIAAELQPVLAMREAQPVSQGGATAPSVAPVTTVQHGGHDFATLVDRLVEARDAVVPQAVRAAITHSEFGQISLRFQQDDAQLTVSMNSADPDFAPAVQAAAAVQSSATADNGTTGQRQDGQGQQQAGSSASSQPQSQSQGSARGGERERTEPNRQPASGQLSHAEDEARPGRGSGIYA